MSLIHELAPARMAALHATARKMAAHARLPFHRRVWKGTGGNWMGAGAGSSIDFQDHRPYLPGDDPRYINWQAYARSGNYSMKLYRQEVSPQMDLLLDVSESMALNPAKLERAVELFYFTLENAWRTGASLRAWLWNAGRPRPLELHELRSHAWPARAVAEPGEALPDLSRVPWRAGSLRVWISDLLFPGNAEVLLRPLASGRGLALIFAPFAQEESDPPWSGNLEMVDCESGAVRLQRVEAELLQEYRRNYQRHFELWRLAARKQEAMMAAVPGGGVLEKALRYEAFASGLVEAVV